MEVLFLLIGFSVLIALFFLGYFVWAVKHGQFDDNYTPAVRILLDDEHVAPHALKAASEAHVLKQTSIS